MLDFRNPKSKKGRWVIAMAITSCRENKHGALCPRFSVGADMIFLCNCDCHRVTTQPPDFSADFDPPFDDYPLKLNLL